MTSQIDVTKPTSLHAFTDTVRGNFGFAKSEIEALQDAVSFIGYGNSFLPISGGQLTGALVLAADPAADMEAATRRYVDTHTPAGVFVPISGGAMTGALSTPGLTVTSMPTVSTGLPNGTYWNDGTVVRNGPAASATVTGPWTFTGAAVNIGAITQASPILSIQGSGARRLAWRAVGTDRWRFQANSSDNLDLIAVGDDGITNNFCMRFTRSDSSTEVVGNITHDQMTTFKSGMFRNAAVNYLGTQATTPGNYQFWLSNNFTGYSLDAGFFNFNNIIGVDTVTTVLSVTAVTQANPARVTTAINHTMQTGNRVTFANCQGMTQLNSGTYIITVRNPTQFDINVDSTSFGAYTGGGLVTSPDQYANSRTLIGIGYTASVGTSGGLALDIRGKDGATTGYYGYGMIPLRSTCNFLYNQGGTRERPLGAEWSLLLAMSDSNTATGLWHNAARMIEMDLDITDSTNVALKSFIKMSGDIGDIATGSLDADHFLLFCNGPNSARWRYGLTVTSYDGCYPFGPNSTIIDGGRPANVFSTAVGQKAAWGIDFNAIDHQQGFIRANGFFVDADGTVQIGGMRARFTGTTGSLDMSGLVATGISFASGGTGGWLSQQPFALYDAAGNNVGWGMLGPVTDVVTGIPDATTISGATVVRMPMLRSNISPPATLTVRAIPGRSFIDGGTFPVNVTWNTTATTLALNPSGGPIVPGGPLRYTATGSTTARSAQDRASDVVNVKDFGAKLDGTANVDGPAVGAALATLQPHEPLFVPSGPASFTWGQVQGTTPTTPVLFKLDGTTSSGGRINRAFSRNDKGDMFENYWNGGKFLSVMSAMPNQPPILHLEYGFNAAGGDYLSVHNPLLISATDNVDAVTAMWGVHVDMNSYSDITTSTWPQQVGISSTLIKHGKAWCAGMHITASDVQNQPSSVGGTLLAFEIGYHVNGLDDGGVSGSPGLRYGMHLSMSSSTPVASGGQYAEFAMGFQVDGSGDALTKSCFGITDTVTYQVFDARTAIVPPGYTSPVAALRMDPGMIVDFNGANTTLNSPGWKGAAGNYLQYTTTGTPRLRYMAGANEVWSVSDASVLTVARATVAPSLMTSTAFDAAQRITSTAQGSGTNGPATAQIGLNINHQKPNYLTTVDVGEIDGLYITVRQGGPGSDCGGMLIDVAGAGTGFLAIDESVVTKQATTTGTTLQSIRTQEGAINPVSGLHFGKLLQAVAGTLTSAILVNNVNAAGYWTNIIQNYRDGILNFSITDGGFLNTLGGVQILGGALRVGSAAPVTGAGGYVVWNRSAGEGETFFANQRGGGSLGGFRFADVTSGDVQTMLVNLTSVAMYINTPVRCTSTIGFNNTAPIAKPTVSGAKGSNAALASLITALASYGLVTDSTTA